jgi:hypothetical protein
MAIAGLRLGFGCELEAGKTTMSDAKMALLQLVEQEADADLRTLPATSEGPVLSEPDVRAANRDDRYWSSPVLARISAERRLWHPRHPEAVRALTTILSHSR